MLSSAIRQHVSIHLEWKSCQNHDTRRPLMIYVKVESLLQGGEFVYSSFYGERLREAFTKQNDTDNQDCSSWLFLVWSLDGTKSATPPKQWYHSNALLAFKWTSPMTSRKFSLVNLRCVQLNGSSLCTGCHGFLNKVKLSEQLDKCFLWVYNS